jgi:hypothetical protein
LSLIPNIIIQICIACFFYRKFEYYKLLSYIKNNFKKASHDNKGMSLENNERKPSIQPSM